MTIKKKEKKGITIKDLYPDLTEEQLQAAEESLQRFFAIIYSIQERIQREAVDNSVSKGLTGHEDQTTIHIS